MINYFRHFFTPHHTNGHRPRALHNNTLSVIIVFLLAFIISLQPLKQKYPSVLGISSSIKVQELLNITNQKRAEAGLSPLTLNSQLSNAANAKASYMFQKNFWAHVAPDGTTPWYFIKNSGYEYLYAGENLARGFNTAPDVVNAWMASPTHRENMLSSNYKDIGFAVQTGTLTGSETVLVVEEFGSRYSATKNTESTNTQEPQSVIPTISKAPLTVAENKESVENTPISSQNQSVTNSKQVIANKNIEAAISNPLIDTKSTKQNLALAILAILIIVLVLDAIIIERRKIVRVVSHNLDHIIFLSILLLAAIIIGGGIIR